MGKLQGDVAIVTGGAQGLGWGIVTKFIHEGAKVVILDYNIQPLQDKTLPESVKVVQGDVTSADSWKKAMTTAIDSFGSLNVVCNNAGIVTDAKPMHETPIEVLDKLLAVNLKAIFVSAQAVVPYFIEKGIKGVFVNTLSTSAIRPRPGLSFYAASKAGAEGATKALAGEYASNGIRFCGVAPSIANTAMTSSLIGPGKDPAALKKLADSLPLGMISEPEDIANMVAQLASKESRLVTGIVVPVDGGRCI